MSAAEISGTGASGPQTQPEPTPDDGKVEGEPLLLRGRLPRVVRFRRGLIVGVAAGVSAVLVAVAWFALDPPQLQVAARDDAGRIDSARPDDALALLPGSYGEVPELGPPLPGDLGRPILAQQQEDAVGTSDTGLATAREERARMLRERTERLAAERRAALESAVLARTIGARSAPSGSEAAAGQGSATQPFTKTRVQKSALASRSGAAGVSSHRLEAPPSPYVLSAGSVIPASLITGLNSDLPGLVTAQVTERVFDTATGRILLIPQGARLIGRYDSKIAFGQRRAMLVWERLVMPDGASLELDNAPATDAAGYAGVADGVDFHTWQLLRGIGMSTLLGVGTELTLGDSESDLVRALRESIQSNADRAGQKIVERNLDIAPTLTVRLGFPVRVLVHKDLVLPQWRG